MNKPLYLNSLILAITACLISPGTAHAHYVDASSAGFIITTVLAFLATVPYLARTYVRRLKHFIRGGRTAEKGNSRAEDSRGQ